MNTKQEHFSNMARKYCLLDGNNGIEQTETTVSNTVHANKSTESLVHHMINRIVLPLLVIASLPTFTMAITYANLKCNGSVSEMWTGFQELPLSVILSELWIKSLNGIGLFTFAIFFGYYAWCIFCTKILPGKAVQGPTTAMGNVPVYADNGLYCYIVTMFVFSLITILLKAYRTTPTVILDHFGELVALMNVCSIIFVFLLYLKGIFAPSTTDSGLTGKGFIFDYYWGTELYPRLFGVDVKVLTNCRFAMTAWPLLVCLCALRSYELYGFVDSMILTTLLQLFYVTKFFYWEAGYYRTMDIVQDRAGFYIIWGCMCLLPTLYPITALYLVQHPIHLGTVWTCLILLTGIALTIVNYLADLQKLIVRQTNGRCKIWGKKPEIIRAQYKMEDGQMAESILLVSGWWGLSRHFHYIPEILLTFCWTVAAGFESILPYFYILFLVVLLVHRSFRDERKCSKKYGRYWDQYCHQVKYRILPSIF